MHATTVDQYVRLTPQRAINQGGNAALTIDELRDALGRRGFAPRSV
jgi:hypothetical protein